jgi:hypothetical protein
MIQSGHNGGYPYAADAVCDGCGVDSRPRWFGLGHSAEEAERRLRTDMEMTGWTITEGRTDRVLCPICKREGIER